MTQREFTCDFVKLYGSMKLDGQEQLDLSLAANFKVIANVVTPAEPHYLKAASPHCDLAGQFGSPLSASFDKGG
jgi:hypothetical protein